ncbi:MAG: type II secretion system F family protein [Alphaproteobacteria bacterium]|nr:type II secretion system F family protein [Alphaproteobacteria bacterium]
MPVFAYEGRGANGEPKKGNVEAADLDAAKARLRLMKINPTTVKQRGAFDIDLELPQGVKELLKPGVGTKDLVIMVRQFSTMIDSGLPLIQCLQILSEQSSNPTLRDQLTVIKEQVESGSTFADALKKFPKTFDDLFRNLVAAGEIGGILDTILNRLATFLEKNEALKRKIKGAMTYPIVVMVVATLVVTVLLVKVVPTFEAMFAEFGGALPAPTQIVVDLSYFMQESWWMIFGGAGAAFYGLKFAYGQPRGKLLIDKILLKLPVMGELLTKVAVARFCRTLGTMVSSGVPILDGLEICARTAGNLVIENAVLNARQSIAEGRTISEPLSEAGVFPEMVCQMISVGENTGALDIMLSKIADFYDEEVDQAVENLTSMMEPLIMVFLGVVVGGFVVAMYLPIFTMAGSIGG